MFWLITGALSNRRQLDLFLSAFTNLFVRSSAESSSTYRQPMMMWSSIIRFFKNHTVGPEGYTPDILAFESQPSRGIVSYWEAPLMIQEIVDIANIVRWEYDSILAIVRIHAALKDKKWVFLFFYSWWSTHFLKMKQRVCDSPHILFNLYRGIFNVLERHGRQQKFRRTICKQSTCTVSSTNKTSLINQPPKIFRIISKNI